ncbi:hypothetical protein [Calothrix sp. NIES-2098]|nr:hypothetical protein NIES2098_15470 [Calothrix sp. NIES-2098]
MYLSRLQLSIKVKVVVRLLMVIRGECDRLCKLTIEAVLRV